MLLVTTFAWLGIAVIAASGVGNVLLSAYEVAKQRHVRVK